jgi:ABC-type nitrate/sulfonate/bicarbonate transport system permease component
VTATTEVIDPVAVVTAAPHVAPIPRRDGWARWILGRLVSLLISLAVVLGTWQLFLMVFHINHFIGRGPLDVWRYLTTGADSTAARTRLIHASRTTLRDAFIGLAAGTVAAVACAVAFSLRRGLERTFMPLAMVLRSVPLVAMTPLIALVFGRDLLGVTVIAGIVTFFPTLVNVSLALRATPQASLDLCAAYGSGQLRTLRKVQLPNALPALFASLRIAAPLALVGALLAEWLATGKGLGYLMLQSESMSNYSQLWSATALVTAYSFLLYTAISGVEKVVLARFSDPAR